MRRNRAIDCPYCGEPIEVEIEAADEPQRYIEDCQVCCRPIEFELRPGSRGGRLRVFRDDE
jgi:hypothetical protein